MSKIVSRTLEVFETFATARRPMSLTELSRQLGIPMSSCHDVVRALEERGYLYELRQRGGYYPTGRLYDLARIIVENDPVTERAEPVLQRLSTELSASVSLGRIKEMQLTYLVVCNPPSPLRFSVAVGHTARNLYATSAGKALLGGLPPEQQATYLEGIELKPMTRHTITSRKRLLAHLHESEARGWYVNREESVDDALTVSARFQWNETSYVLTAAGTLRRMESQLDEAVRALHAAIAELQTGAS